MNTLLHSRHRILGDKRRLCAAGLAIFTVIAAMQMAPAFALEFSAAQQLPFDYTTLTARPHSAVVGDANGDGRADVLFFMTDDGNYETSERYIGYLYEQQANGTMLRAMKFDMAPGGAPKAGDPHGPAFGDLDGDGIAELVMPDPPHKSLIIFKRAADTYEEVKRLSLPVQEPAFYQIVIDDLDADGFPEILYQNTASGFAVYRGLGQLAFAPPMLSLVHPAKGFALQDADGDGTRDLLVASNSVDLNELGFAINFGKPRGPHSFIGLGPTHFSLPAFVEGERSFAVGAGAFGGDARPEIVVLTRTEYPPDQNNTVRMPETLLVYRMNDRGHYTLLKRHEYADIGRTEPPVMRIADLDGDGRDEIYVFNLARLEVLRQEGDGFAPVYLPPVLNGIIGMGPVMGSTHFADFNGDGCLDVGYVSNGYAIHLRTDCPTTNPLRVSRRAAAPPKPLPAPGKPPRRGGRLRR